MEEEERGGNEGGVSEWRRRREEGNEGGVSEWGRRREEGMREV